MTTIKVDDITNVAGSGAPNFSDGLKYNGTALSSINKYQYTSSATEPSNPNNGALWWDSANSLPKIYINNAWKTVALSSVDLSTIILHGGDRGLFAGAYPGQTNAIDYVSIPTTGNAADFGDLLRSSGYMTTASNRTIGMFAGGRTGIQNSTGFDDIDYITFATLGNAANAGSFSVTRRANGQGLYSNGYAYVVGGQITYGSGMTGATEIEYFTLSTNITSIGDFGDLTIGASNKLIGGVAQDTSRGVLFNTNSYTSSGSINYLSIGGTSGNSASFGDLTVARVQGLGLSSRTRGVYVGGNDGTSIGGADTANMKTMDYVTIQTTGNATDFGDLDQFRDGPSGSSNASRGVISGHGGSGSSTNSIEYITIDTTGNGVDFGDLVIARNVGAKGMSGAA
tara:strand:+ start:403 stop:1593 length:1191 start_codon:yes stop_codon:yes gene_type:complete